MATGGKRVAVLISGRGSNLKALIKHQQGYSVGLVISNRPQAGGLEIARDHGIQALCVDHSQFNKRVDFEGALIKILDKYQPNLIVLAGFMRILTSFFVDKYLNRLINIHPSLLPDFAGLHPHQQALDSGAKYHGASVHFVTPELDAGPIIGRWKIAVLPNERLESLKERTLKIEHLLLPKVVALFSNEEITLAGDQAWLKNRALPATGIDFES